MKIPCRRWHNMQFKVAREGIPFVAVPGLVALVLAGRGRQVAAAPFALAALASLAFFRDPDRTAPAVPEAVLAPADGRVMSITDAIDPFVGEATRLSIFLSPLDVHINRSPVAALVVGREDTRGEFLAAYKPGASEINERCALHLQTDGTRVTVTQVAGVLARRIVCRVTPGDKLEAGQRYGMIRFGSRTDLFVPRGTRIHVHEGERVRGGETVIGVLR
jgi:phosphatidylserine decarboxylase